MIIIVMGVCGCGKSTIGQEIAKQLGWSFADADEFHPQENKIKMSEGLPLTDEDRYPWLLAIHTYIQRLLYSHESGVVTCSALKYSYRDILRYGNRSNHFLCISVHADNPKDSRENNASQHDTGNKRANESSYEKSKYLESSTSPDTEELEKEVGYQDTTCNNESETRSNDGCGKVVFVHLTGERSVLESRLGARQGHFMPAALLQSQLDTLEPLTITENGLQVDIDRTSNQIVQDIIGKLNL